MIQNPRDDELYKEYLEVGTKIRNLLEQMVEKEQTATTPGILNTRIVPELTRLEARQNEIFNELWRRHHK